MIDAGYPSVDICGVRKAYEYGMKLFTGYYRPSGKPLINHLVGTASVLAWLKLPAKVISAGLLHSIYLYGEFGCRDSKKIKLWMRNKIRNVVGEDVEDLIEGYMVYPWGAEILEKIHEKIDPKDERVKLIYLLNLANELDDQMDLGPLYCEAFIHQDFYYEKGARMMAAIAVKLGHLEFSQRIRATYEAAKRSRRPGVLLRKDKETRLIPLAGYGLKHRAAVRQFMGRMSRAATGRKKVRPKWRSEA